MRVFYRIDGGGSVEHLSERGGPREGYSLCGTRSRTGAWVSLSEEKITSVDQPTTGVVCKRCVRIAFPLAKTPVG